MDNEKTTHRVSSIFEKVFSPDGRGLMGFTEYYDAGGFKNHLEFFNAQNHAEIRQIIEEKHSTYLKNRRKQETEA